MTETLTAADQTRLLHDVAQARAELFEADTAYTEFVATMDRRCPFDLRRSYALSDQVRWARKRLARLEKWAAEHGVATDPEPEPEPPAPAVDLRKLARHTNMEPAWFDQAVHRAMLAGLNVYESPEPGVAYVDSESRGTLHTVTRESCTCAGFAAWHRCEHVALLIAWTEAFHDAWLPDPTQTGRRLTVRRAA